MPEDQMKEAIYHLGTYYIPLDSETEICRNHSGILFESFLNYDIWALRSKYSTISTRYLGFRFKRHVYVVSPILNLVYIIHGEESLMR